MPTQKLTQLRVKKNSAKGMFSVCSLVSETPHKMWKVDPVPLHLAPLFTKCELTYKLLVIYPL